MRTFLTLVLAASLAAVMLPAQTTTPPASTDTTTLTADLSPLNQIPPISDSNVRGTAQIQITPVQATDGSMGSAVVSFSVTLQNAQAADFTGLTINQGSATETGSVVIDSGLGSGGTLPGQEPTGDTISRQVTLTTSTQLGAVQAILANPENYYVNLTTADNASGLLRGQLSAGGGGEMDNLSSKVDAIKAQLNILQDMLRRVGLAVGVTPDNLPTVPTEPGTGSSNSGGSTSQ